MWLILERAHYKRKIKRQIVIIICAPKVAATSALYSYPFVHPYYCLGQHSFVFIIDDKQKYSFVLFQALKHFLVLLLINKEYYNY